MYVYICTYVLHVLHVYIHTYPLLPCLLCSAVVVHFERSEYFGREVADSESKVEYAVVAEGQFEVNFTVTVETEDATAKGNQDMLNCPVCVWVWVCVCVCVCVCVRQSLMHSTMTYLFVHLLM